VAQCESSELPQLVESFENARRDANRNRPRGPLPQISYGIEGTWRLPEEADRFSQRFREAMTTREVACG
jgi:hypothetical protein